MLKFLGRKNRNTSRELLERLVFHKRKRQVPLTVTEGKKEKWTQIQVTFLISGRILGKFQDGKFGSEVILRGKVREDEARNEKFKSNINMKLLLNCVFQDICCIIYIN